MKFLVSPFKAKYENGYTWIKKGVEEKWHRFWWASDADRVTLISQRFGSNAIPLYKELGMTGHNGTDWAIPNGTCLYAVHDGVITQAENTGGGYGARIRLRFDHNRQTYEMVYGHLERPLVSVGQEVRAGELIGLSNNSGQSTGPHLHTGLRRLDKSYAVIDYYNGYFGYIDEYDYYYEVELTESSDLKDLHNYFKNTGKWPWRKKNWLEAMKILGVSGWTRSQYYRYLLKH